MSTLFAAKCIIAVLLIVNGLLVYVVARLREKIHLCEYRFTIVTQDRDFFMEMRNHSLAECERLKTRIQYPVT